MSDAPAATPPPALPARTGACGAATKAAADTLREGLVANAVQFLQHPNVVGTPLARRVAFLKRKGLTSSEIDAAVRRAAAAGPSSSSSSSVVVATVPTTTAGAPAAAPTPFWGSWKGAVCTALMAAGIGCGAALVYDFYLKPWWQKRRATADGAAAGGDSDSEDAHKSTEEMLETIRKNQAEMLGAIAELTAAINSLPKQ